MDYRKFTADRIFTGHDFAEEGMVVITDQSGKIVEVIDRSEAGDDVQQLNGLLSPGFINCHCHLELSHLKGLIPEGTGMISFLLSVMGNRNFPLGEILAGIETAEANMIESGIVAVGDTCNTTDSLQQKSKRNLFYRHFIEAVGVVSNSASARFDQAKAIYRAFQDLDPGKTTIVPHAPYSVSPELLAMINVFDPHALLSIHNQESAAENEFFLTGSGEMINLFSAIGVAAAAVNAPGISSLRHYLPMIGKDHSLILVHNVTTDSEDLKWIKSAGKELPLLHWCLCPNANLYISGVLPDIQLLSENLDSIVLGTDSLASNHSLNILSELKTIQEYFSEISLVRLLRWATLNGAKALSMEENFGTIGKGKKPGLILIEGLETDKLQKATSRRLI